MKGSKHTKILFLLLAIAVLIRIPGLFHFAFSDEFVGLSSKYWMNWHPPLSILTHSLFNFILGSQVWVNRLLIMLIGIANITLVYFITNHIYGKKPAKYAAAIMTFGVYPILASLQIDIDGSFLLLFYLIGSLSFIKYELSQERKWLFLTGLSVGLGLLTKYSAIFLIAILGLYHLTKERKIMNSIRLFLIISLIGIVVFSIFPLTSWLIGSEAFSTTISHFSRYVSPGTIQPMLLLIQYLLPLIWLGPLFIFGFLLSITKSNKNNKLSLIWIVIIILAYTFLNKDNFKPLERYFLVLIAPFSMIIGNYLSKIRFNKKHLISFCLLFAVFLSLFFILGFKGGAFLNFYPKTEFIENALSLNWNFYLPITGSSGPVGFYLLFSVVAYSFILSGLLFMILFYLNFKKERHWFKIFLIIFLSLGTAYNVFVAQEYLLSSTTPNVSKVSKEVLEYIELNGYEEPLYIFRNKAFMYYLELDYGELNLLDFNAEFDEDKTNSLIQEPGTVIVIDFPTMNKDSLLWETLMQCNLIKEFEDKDVTLGYIFDCKVEQDE